ncbi:MAG: lytic transglycosylase domain-containing protein [Bacteroidales bacterium]|jgi:hypothetical protein|nr:lytic transglycosylase domain-containing protein [Bacteroidales bacterium]
MAKIKQNIFLFLFIGIIIGFSIPFLFAFDDTTKNVEKTKKHYTNPSKVYSPYIPDSVFFCDEKVPIEIDNIYEALDYELIINMYRHSSTLIYLKRANKYFPEIEKFLEENNLPDDIKYLCVAESGLENGISSSGAVGFWQFMKKTGTEFGLTINNDVDERYNTKLSMNAAGNFLKQSYRKFGSWSLATASYNMGVSGLQKDISNQKINSYWDLYLNKETSRYIFRILALKIIMNNPKIYGYEISDDELYKVHETYSITIDTTINDLVQFAFDNNINYKILKYYNPWLISNQLINKEKKTYEIILPIKK